MRRPLSISSRLCCNTLLCVLVFVMLVSLAAAQETTGGINGYVKDRTGAAIAKAFPKCEVVGLDPDAETIRQARAAADSGRLLNEAAVKVLGPASALIARRADHFRAHLLIETASRSTLQRFLKNWLPHVEQLLKAAGLRWSIDVDPLEVD